MFGLLNAQAPTKQTATDAINTLSSRLQDVRLLEDRRAAILGLRSFAKEYPASVASGALRALIGSLSRDGDDVDTVKVVLETLLILFNPNESSPESSEELSLWLADEFTQRQENITCLLDFLGTHDFYSRLYSLKLLAAIQSARLDRTQECVFSAPLGISRLVAVLDDRHEAIRNEGLSLLISLTASSPEIQKLVAFENGFERIINLMHSEGGLSQGGIVIQDCLTLLASLLRFNVSNQSLFRETDCVPKLAKLVADTVAQLDSDSGLAEWAKPQRDRNLWGILAIIRLFLVHAGLGTQANQLSWWFSGITPHILTLAFGESTTPAVRAEALTACADLVRGNPKIQESFAQLQVNHLIQEFKSRPTSPQQGKVQPLVNVIHGLLDATLEISSNTLFDVRLAACECIKAYIYQHDAIRRHFLQRTIEGHKQGADETANALTVLLANRESRRASDPYRSWLASVIVTHLIFDNPEGKAVLMSVTDGDASAGEETVTCIQALTGILIAGLQRAEDARVSIGYMMLLCCWLWEDPDAVNDFLGEASGVSSLFQAAVQAGPEAALVQGMCTVLLGIVYEFSTKDSPVTRATIHKMLCSSLGREQYIDKLTRFREHPVLRDYEVLHQGLGDKQAGGLPDVFFDKTFVNFVKDNYSRILRAVDRDPGMEISVLTNGVQKGISRELVDTLRMQVDDKNLALQKAENEILTLERRLGQEQAELRRAKETAAMELGRIRTVNEGLQRHHDEAMSRLQAENNSNIQRLQAEHRRVVDDLQRQMQQHIHDSETSAARAREHYSAEIADLTRTLRSLEKELEKVNKDHVQDLQTANEEFTAQLSALEARLRRAEVQAEDAERRAKIQLQAAAEAAASAAAAKEALAKSEENASKTQTELDDLLIVLADLEEKRAVDKKRLKDLGETVSDDSDADETLEGDEADVTESQNSS